MIAGDLDHKPELPILLALTEDHDAALLRRWLRTAGPQGRPLDLLLRRDFAAFVAANVAPWIAEAASTLCHSASSVCGFGGSSSSIRDQMNENSWRARNPASRPSTIANGL